MIIFERIIFHAFGSMAGLFAWWSVQPGNEHGWLTAIAAGAILSAVIRRAAMYASGKPG